jgi:hypothetical protein
VAAGLIAFAPDVELQNLQAGAAQGELMLGEHLIEPVHARALLEEDT